MKIFLRDRQDVEGQPQLDQVDGKWFLGGNDLRLSEFFEPGTYQCLFSTTRYGLIGIDGRMLFEQRDTGSTLLRLGISDPVRPVAALWCGDTLEDSTLLVASSCRSRVESVKDVPEDLKQRTNLHIIGSYDDRAMAAFSRWEAKRRLIEQISTLDMMAAMEAQLDLVTEALFKLGEKTGNSQVVETFLAGLRDTSVLSIKGPAPDVLAETINQKGWMRQLQIEYFSEVGRV